MMLIKSKESFQAPAIPAGYSPARMIITHKHYKNHRGRRDGHPTQLFKQTNSHTIRNFSQPGKSSSNSDE